MIGNSRHRCHVLVAAVAVAVTGCSATFVDSWRPNVYGRDPTCTTSYAMPIVDGILATAAIASTMNVLTSDNPMVTGVRQGGSVEAAPGPIAGLAIIALVAPALLSAISGVRGTIAVAHCNDNNANAFRHF